MAFAGHCCMFTLLLFLGLGKCMVLRNNSTVEATYICGSRQIKPHPRNLKGPLGIVNGKEVRPEHSQPWVVGFVNRTYTKTGCGGTLIHPKFVLSAWHCFHNEKKRRQRMYAVLGLHDHANPNPNTVQYIKIKQHFKDPRIWHYPSIDYDLGLLELEYSAKLGEEYPYVGTACLPNPYYSYDGQSVMTSGWGSRRARPPIFSQVEWDSMQSEIRSRDPLMTVSLEVVPYEECENILKKVDPRIQGIGRWWICAAGQNPVVNGTFGDACGGDSGGPLTWTDPEWDTTYLIGVVQRGLGCGWHYVDEEKGHSAIPGIYARVADPYVIQWIDDCIKRHRCNLPVR